MPNDVTARRSRSARVARRSTIVTLTSGRRQAITNAGQSAAGAEIDERTSTGRDQIDEAVGVSDSVDQRSFADRAASLDHRQRGK